MSTEPKAQTTPDAAPHCFRPPMPIERMVDQSTGIQRGDLVRRSVTLECPKCKRTRRVPMEFTDPPGTARVSMGCPKCEPEPTIIDYFNNAGQQINVDGELM